MLRKSGAPAALVFIVTFALTSLASARDVNRFDFSVGAAGVFSKTATNASITLKPTNSYEVLGTVRFRFNRMHAIAFNIGRANNAQVFLTPHSFRVQTGITELTGAYVFSPFQTARVEPFLFGGGGALRFNPGTTYIDGFQSSFGAAQQTSLAVLYGAGVDYHLWRRLALRLQYRGLFYKNPDFKVQNLFTGTRGHMAEPSAGIVLKF